MKVGELQRAKGEPWCANGGLLLLVGFWFLYVSKSHHPNQFEVIAQPDHERFQRFIERPRFVFVAAVERTQGRNRIGPAIQPQNGHLTGVPHLGYWQWLEERPEACPAVQGSSARQQENSFQSTLLAELPAAAARRWAEHHSRGLPHRRRLVHVRDLEGVVVPRVERQCPSLAVEPDEVAVGRFLEAKLHAE